MQSQKAVFSLRGTNISLPNRYKIRKYRPSKSKSEKVEAGEEVEEPLPFIIQAKETFTRPPLKISLPPPDPGLREILPIRQTTQRIQNSTPVRSIPTEKQEETVALQVASQTRVRREAGSLFRRGREHCNSMKAKRCACGNCQDCMKDFTYFLRLFSEDQSVPEISAKSWCIWRRKSNRYAYYYGKRIHKVREIASLTKMVTAMAAVDFLARHQLDPQRIRYAVRKTSTLIGGTTAKLAEGQVATLLELFYGMMLPSGNDAAIAVSQAIGLLSFLKGKGRQLDPYAEDWYEKYQTKNYAYLFIGMMNEKCQKVGTLDTRLFNSHGNDAYDQLKNVSTCNEIAKLSSEFMGYPLLRAIVATAQHGPYQNTNRLLEDGFDGIKTGITDSAGPCLAASYKDLIVVVLHSRSMNERWFQVKKLVKWILRKS